MMTRVTPLSTAAKRRKLHVVLAFAAVYVLWGSTYLAIKIAIDSIPPMLMGAARFLVAGSIMLAIAIVHGAPMPTAREWRTVAIVGIALLCGGNGAVVWSETRLPSGLVALLVAIAPVWFALGDWWRRDGRPPTLLVTMGLVTGLLGVALLVGPDALSGRIDPLAVVVVLFGSLSWVVGSLYGTRAPSPKSGLVSSGGQMIAGGVAMFILGAARGEIADVNFGAMTMSAVLALLYLIIFGSLIGFTAYSYLLRNVAPARVATYAYVNPVVAVFLGWAILGEQVNARTAIAAAIVVLGVALITTGRAGPVPATTADPHAHDVPDAA